MMRARLRMLLASFNKCASDYALARLEIALADPQSPSPPVVERVRPTQGHDDEFAIRWPKALVQVAAAADFIAAAKPRVLDEKHAPAWTHLGRAVKMLTQFAEGIEWLGAAAKRGATGEGRR